MRLQRAGPYQSSASRRPAAYGDSVAYGDPGAYRDSGAYGDSSAYGDPGAYADKASLQRRRRVWARPPGDEPYVFPVGGPDDPYIFSRDGDDRGRGGHARQRKGGSDGDGEGGGRGKGGGGGGDPRRVALRLDNNTLSMAGWWGAYAPIAYVAAMLFILLGLGAGAYFAGVRGACMGMGLAMLYATFFLLIGL